MTVWKNGVLLLLVVQKLSAKLWEVIFSTETVPRGQNKCASGDKSGGRMGQMWVEGVPLESRIFVAVVHATKQLYFPKYEIQNSKNYIWNTKYQNISLKKTDVVVGRVPWWWWMYKKALLAFSSSQEFLLPSECLNIQHRVLCGNKTNIWQRIWCTKNQKNIWSNPITHCISSYANL